jgi:hypothetical protein
LEIALVSKKRLEILHHVAADVPRRSRCHETMSVFANVEMRVRAHPSRVLRTFKHKKKPAEASPSVQ